MVGASGMAPRPFWPGATKDGFAGVKYETFMPSLQDFHALPGLTWKIPYFFFFFFCCRGASCSSGWPPAMVAVVAR